MENTSEAKNRHTLIEQYNTKDLRFLMSKRLWVGAGTLFVGAFVLKQYLFQQVSVQVKDIREAEHKAATRVLHEVYEKGHQNKFLTFTEEEKRKIVELGLLKPDDKDN